MVCWFYNRVFNYDSEKKTLFHRTKLTKLFLHTDRALP